MAERKHTHFRCDLHHYVAMSIPKFLWSNAIFTVSYLVNRVPSHVLSREIPLRRLHPYMELFHLPPKYLDVLPSFRIFLSPGLLTSCHPVLSNVFLLVILVLRRAISVITLLLDDILFLLMSSFSGLFWFLLILLLIVSRFLLLLRTIQHLKTDV